MNYLETFKEYSKQLKKKYCVSYVQPVEMKKEMRKI